MLAFLLDALAYLVLGAFGVAGLGAVLIIVLKILPQVDWFMMGMFLAVVGSVWAIMWAASRIKDRPYRGHTGEEYRW